MLDTALIESAEHHGNVRTARSLPFAIGFHAAVIGGLIASAVLSTGEPPEPEIPIVFPVFAAGPPPPPAGGPAPIQPVASQVRPRGESMVPVVRIPDQEPQSSPSDPQAEGTLAIGTEPGAGETGPGATGAGPGVPFGTGTQGGPGPGGDILQPGVGGVTSPELIERIDPVYPEPARKLRQEGMVILEAVITASGVVDEVRVVASAGPLLDAAALSAVRRWRYRPATLNGRAVGVFLTVSVRFGLSG